MTFQILITRPAEQAAYLASQLSARDIDCLIDSVLMIAPEKNIHIDTARFDTVVISSQHALDALNQSADIRLLTVGQKTAQVARQRGFLHAQCAGETFAELIAFIRTQPQITTILYARGETITESLIEALPEHRVEEQIVYHAIATTALLETTKGALTNQTLDAVTFYSRRTARIFETLIIAAKLQHTLAHSTACCLSPSIASALQLDWRSVRIAKNPRESAMLTLIDHVVDADHQ